MIRAAVILALASTLASSLGACARPSEAPYSGFVDSPVSAVVSQVAGKIEQVAVHEGERVHKGQLLARLDSRERQAAVAEAEANLERAQQSLKQAAANVGAVLSTVRGAGAGITRAQVAVKDAQRTFERSQNLSAQGAASTSELDSASARLDEAQANLEVALAGQAETRGRVSVAMAGQADASANVQSAQAALELAKVRVEQTAITSPYDGLVVELDLRAGEWAAPGSPLVTVEDASAPWVRLDVGETQFRELRLGRAAQIQVVALPGRSFTGTVSTIGAEGDFALNRDVKRGRPDIRTFLVRVSFDRPTLELRPGMTALVQLAASGSKPGVQP